MTTQTQTLAGFLLARIAEDEAAARAASVGTRWTWDSEHVQLQADHVERIGQFRSPECIIDTEGANPPGPEPGAHIARHDPARVLAECEAHRRIVASHQWHIDTASRPFAYERVGEALLAERHAKVLAAVYADHPDFRPEWRP